jgi:hypothetical protein
MPYRDFAVSGKSGHFDLGEKRTFLLCVDTHSPLVIYMPLC